MATPNPVPFLGLMGGIEYRLAMLRRDNPVVFSGEYDERRLDLVYFGQRIITVPDQQPGGNEWVMLGGGIGQGSKRRFQDNGTNRLFRRLFKGHLDGDAGADGFPIEHPTLGLYPLAHQKFELRPAV